MPIQFTTDGSPGYRRLVHYVETSPQNQVQPRHFTQLYAKPGDAVDLDQPVIFHDRARYPHFLAETSC